MGHCQRIKILFKLIPIKSLQYSLIQNHILKCDACQNDLADIDEARSATIPKDELKEVKNLWPQVLKDLKHTKQRKKVILHPAWRWALGSAAALALTMSIIFIMTRSNEKGHLNDIAVKLTIDYINLNEEPAQAIIFQTQDNSKTFVWVEKLSKGDTP